MKAKGAQGYVSVKDEKARKVARIKQQNEENRELFKGSLFCGLVNECD